VTTESIPLTDQETAMLRAVSEQTGKKPAEILRQAVAEFLARFGEDDRRALMHQAFGMWRDRTDLPSIEALRRESDRRVPGGERADG
jgi:hypothetical protein